jgi:hypothetical protein
MLCLRQGGDVVDIWGITYAADIGIGAGAGVGIDPIVEDERASDGGS